MCDLDKVRVAILGEAFRMRVTLVTDFHNSLDKEGRIIAREWSRYAEKIGHSEIVTFSILINGLHNISDR